MALTGTTALGASATSAPATGGISGHVNQAGHPADRLRGVIVTANGPDGSHLTRTAADGTYAFAGLPPGGYAVCFTALEARGGSGDPFGYLGECYDDTRRFPDTVVVTSHAVTTGIAAGLSLGGAASGRITEFATGAPLANVLVKVYLFSRGVVYAYTDADGRWVVKGLHHGQRYHLYVDGTKGVGGSADAQGYSSPRLLQYWPLHIVEGRHVRNLDAALIGVGAVAGRVTGSDASSLCGIDVEVFIHRGVGGFAHTATTGCDGAFFIPGLYASGPDGFGIRFTDRSGRYLEKFRRTPPVVPGSTSTMTVVLDPDPDA